MIVSNAPPARPAQTPKKANPVPAEPPPRDQHFAALLRQTPSKGARLSDGAIPTYNQSDDQAQATSFEAMPLIAPVAIDLSDADGVQAAVGGRTDLAGAQEPQGPGTPDQTEAGANDVRAPVATLGTSLHGSIAPTAPRQREARAAAISPVAAIAPQPTPSPARSVSHEPAGAPRSPIRGAALPPAGEPIAFALGAGVSVHLHSDGAQLRVTVRGLRMEAADRGEITGRIAKLMRAHGHEISEQMIDFEGTGQ